MSHRNAPLTSTGRARLVSLIIDHGWSQRRAAERLNVSPATANRWVTRHRAGESPDTGPASHWATAPPRDSPARWKDATPSASRVVSRSVAMSGTV
ncbi:MAG: helix-turn-helix domain-containing protein [Corynebacterium variabile]|uniref:helix-turn-helix domain-containing protein n=1 Tax=Corynebacterium variabile TaxID=1727 RepID=UPI003F938907